jgi:hypothetical protein
MWHSPKFIFSTFIKISIKQCYHTNIFSSTYNLILKLDLTPFFVNGECKVWKKCMIRGAKPCAYLYFESDGCSGRDICNGQAV